MTVFGGRCALEFVTVLGSLFGYFAYIVTAFAALTGLMIITFGGDSTLGKVLHYPRPVAERTVAATNPQHRLFMLASKQESTAKESMNGSGVVSSEKVDGEKGKRETFAHAHKISSQRGKYEGQGYSVAAGNAAGYRPGLDSQR
jgi:hypothetical protein